MGSKPKNEVAPLNKVKKLTGWQKFKRGLGKVWGFVKAPIQAAASLIPGVGGLISTGLGMLGWLYLFFYLNLFFYSREMSIIFKQILDYPNYEVSETGIVINSKGKIIKQNFNSSGYLRVYLSEKRK